MSEMKKWVVQWDAGMVGTDCVQSYYGPESREEVEKMFYEDVMDWFESFSHNDLTQDDGEVDEDEYEDRRSELSAWAEEYDPEQHDGLRCADTVWAWEK